jgi:hypothetical protein
LEEVDKDDGRVGLFWRGESFAWHTVKRENHAWYTQKRKN